MNYLYIFTSSAVYLYIFFYLYIFTSSAVLNHRTNTSQKQEKWMAVGITIVRSSMTSLSLYNSCWWCQTWNTCLYFTVVSQYEVRYCTGHGINTNTFVLVKWDCARNYISPELLVQHCEKRSFCKMWHTLFNYLRVHCVTLPIQTSVVDWCGLVLHRNVCMLACWSVF